eukprot:TRINITY_DN7079_c3_g3_i1.p1 TRINITY_DN7079_c3_g3~~TRINITY_DN7079_c3_g3_i1.p1  ORF type:complete len:962 (+),score=224.87 TRINITY_DN7079_c3_g3_i1:65-2950(+)
MFFLPGFSAPAALHMLHASALGGFVCGAGNYFQQLIERFGERWGNEDDVPRTVEVVRSIQREAGQPVGWSLSDDLTITTVEHDSPAATAGVVVGMRLLTIGGEMVSSRGDVEKAEQQLGELTLTLEEDVRAMTDMSADVRPMISSFATGNAFGMFSAGLWEVARTSAVHAPVPWVPLAWATAVTELVWLPLQVTLIRGDVAFVAAVIPDVCLSSVAATFVACLLPPLLHSGSVVVLTHMTHARRHVVVKLALAVRYVAETTAAFTLFAMASVLPDLLPRRTFGATMFQVGGSAIGVYFAAETWVPCYHGRFAWFWMCFNGHGVWWFVPTVLPVCSMVFWLWQSWVLSDEVQGFHIPAPTDQWTEWCENLYTFSRPRWWGQLQSPRGEAPARRRAPQYHLKRVVFLQGRGAHKLREDFTSKVRQMNRDTARCFNPSVRSKDRVDVSSRLDAWAKCTGRLSRNRRCRLVPVWHGCTHEMAEVICDQGSGFRDLRLTDGGFFGAGVYTTLEKDYACSYSTRAAVGKKAVAALRKTVPVDVDPQKCDRFATACGIKLDPTDCLRVQSIVEGGAAHRAGARQYLRGESCWSIVEIHVEVQAAGAAVQSDGADAAIGVRFDRFRVDEVDKLGCAYGRGVRSGCELFSLNSKPAFDEDVDHPAKISVAADGDVTMGFRYVLQSTFQVVKGDTFEASFGVQMLCAIDGIRVARVVEGGPAEKEGVRAGWLLSSLCGSVVEEERDLERIFGTFEGTRLSACFRAFASEVGLNKMLLRAGGKLSVLMKPTVHVALLCVAAVGATYPITRQGDYATPDDWSWSSVSNFHFAHPVTEEERRTGVLKPRGVHERTDKALCAPYDSHFVCVGLHGPEGSATSRESGKQSFQASTGPETADYHELVLKDHQQVLPVAKVYFSDEPEMDPASAQSRGWFQGRRDVLQDVSPDDLIIPPSPRYGRTVGSSTIPDLRNG